MLRHATAQHGSHSIREPPDSMVSHGEGSSVSSSATAADVETTLGHMDQHEHDVEAEPLSTNDESEDHFDFGTSHRWRWKYSATRYSRGLAVQRHGRVRGWVMMW